MWIIHLPADNRLDAFDNDTKETKILTQGVQCAHCSMKLN